MKTDIHYKDIIRVASGAIILLLGTISSCNVQNQKGSLQTHYSTDTPRVSETPVAVNSGVNPATHTAQPTDKLLVATNSLEETTATIGTGTESGNISTGTSDFNNRMKTLTAEHGGGSATLIVTIPSLATKETAPTTGSTNLPDLTVIPSLELLRTETPNVNTKPSTPKATVTAAVFTITKPAVNESAQSAISTKIRPTSDRPLSQTVSTLEEQLNELKNQLDEARAELETAESERASLSSQLEATEKLLEDLESKLANSEENNADLEVERSRLNLSIADLQSRIAVLDNEIRNLDEKIAIRQDEIARLDRIITEEHEQQLWDIISPILGAITGVVATIVAARVYSGVISVRAPSATKRGSYAILEMHVVKGVNCTPTIIYKSSKDRTLKPQMQQTGVVGKLSWRWLIPRNAGKGEAIIRIQCFPSGKIVEREFTVK